MPGKRNKNFVLLIVFLVLFGVFLMVRMNEQENLSGTFTLFEMKKNADKIEISESGKTEVVFQKNEGGIWKFAEPLVYDIDSRKLSNLLELVEDFQVNRRVYSEVEKMQKTYAVDSTGLNLKVFAGEELLADVFIGNNTPSGGNTFVRLNGSDKIYESIGRNKAIVDVKVDQWRKKEILELRNENVKSISGEYNGYSYDIAQSDTLWTFSAEGQTMPINETTLETMRTKLTMIKANKFIDEGFDKYDFSDYDMKFVLSMKDFETYTIYCIEMSEDAEEYKNQVIVKLEGRDDVLFVLAKSYFKDLKKNIEELTKDNEKHG